MEITTLKFEILSYTDYIEDVHVIYMKTSSSDRYK